MPSSFWVDVLFVQSLLHSLERVDDHTNTIIPHIEVKSKYYCQVKNGDKLGKIMLSRQKGNMIPPAQLKLYFPPLN